MKPIKILPWIPIIGVILTCIYWDDVGLDDFGNKFEYYGSAAWQGLSSSTILYLISF